MSIDVKFGTISFIEDRRIPVTSGIQSLGHGKNSWIIKALMGLAATANKPPPKTITDFGRYRASKDFRALMFCHLRIEMNASGNGVSNVKLVDSTLDPGWTPPFNIWRYPTSLLPYALDWFTDTGASMRDSRYYAGEMSPLSTVSVQRRHPNTTIAGIPSREVLLANMLIKFRAGTHTDNIGVKTAGSPFHVPWVWCEAALTLDNGQLKLYGRGSIFPTHYWYLQGDKALSQNQVGDDGLPRVETRGASNTEWDEFATVKVEFQLKRLNLYKVLSIGAPASRGQTALGADSKQTGTLDKHQYTAPGGKTQGPAVKPLPR